VPPECMLSMEVENMAQGFNLGRVGLDWTNVDVIRFYRAALHEAQGQR
jgi:hypothetical protein